MIKRVEDVVLWFLGSPSISLSPSSSASPSMSGSISPSASYSISVSPSMSASLSPSEEGGGRLFGKGMPVLMLWPLGRAGGD